MICEDRSGGIPCTGAGEFYDDQEAIIKGWQIPDPQDAMQSMVDPGHRAGLILCPRHNGVRV